MQKLTLIHNRVCPFAQRAVIASYEKKVQVQLREVSLTEKEQYLKQTYKKAECRDPNSDGQVPLLVVGAQVLAQSDLISWYLAEKYESGSELIPKDHLQRAKMRHFIQTYPPKLIGAFYGFKGQSKKNQEDKTSCFEKAYSALNSIEENLVGPFSLGQDFRLSDIIVYPWLERACVLEKLCGFKIQEQKYPKLVKFIKAVQQRQSVKATMQTQEFYVEQYKSYFL